MRLGEAINIVSLLFLLSLYSIMFTPLGGGHIIFAFSGVQFPVISRKSIYPNFTKFGMGVYWVNSLHGIAFGEDSSIAN